MIGLNEIKAKNINLERPINVLEEFGTNIEIHAEVLESKRSVQEIKVAIYSQESAYSEPHFSAIFEINPKSESKKTDSFKQ